jgi:sterol desaturase/sphingolipid hydroxylase (fatty acid hydroxylase superfamily)
VGFTGVVVTVIRTCQFYNEGIELIDHSFGFYGFAFFGIILARYFLVAGGTHLFFYSAWGKTFARRKSRHEADYFQETRNISREDKSPPWRSIHRDIKLSVLSAMVFAVSAALIMSGYQWGITRLYNDFQSYGLWYLGVSYGAVMMLQDTYFYFTHRLFHHPLLFRWLHQGHHRSRKPTPWTSFAFDPLEAIVQALFLIGIVFVIPLHFITLIAVLTTMTVWAVVNHLGLERLPSSFPHHWFGRWFIGPAHHSIHHCKYTMHYGLYFTFWDKLLGTHDPDYEKELDDLCHSLN